MGGEEGAPLAVGGVDHPLPPKGVVAQVGGGVEGLLELGKGGSLLQGKAVKP